MSMIDKLALQLYGITPHEAHTRGICISCKQRTFLSQDTPHLPGQIYSRLGTQEYSSSALCETCFDKQFPQE